MRQKVWIASKKRTKETIKTCLFSLKNLRHEAEHIPQNIYVWMSYTLASCILHYHQRWHRFYVWKVISRHHYHHHRMYKDYRVQIVWIFRSSIVYFEFALFSKEPNLLMLRTWQRLVVRALVDLQISWTESFYEKIS